MTGPRAAAPFARRPPVGALRVLLDTAVLTLLVVVAGGAFAPAYGSAQFARALLVGALVGAVAAAVPRLLRWPGAVTVLLVPVLLVAAGPAGALPEQAAGGVLPTPAALRLLAAGVVDSWKQLLTVAVPVGTGGALLVPVLLSAAVLTALAVVVATRTRLPLLALLPAAAMAVAAALLGSATPFLPQYLATGWVAVAVLWAAWRRGTTGRPGLEARRPLALALVLLPALAAGTLLGPQLVAGDAVRTTLRDVVQPPFDPSTVPSPLAAYRRYVVTDRDVPQLSVTGLPAGTSLRLAVLSDYNGRYALTSPDVGTFTRVGDRIAGSPPGDPVTLQVQVEGYSDIWLPTAGSLRSISFAGDDATRLREEFRYNRETGAGVVTGGLRPGDAWTATVALPRQPTVAEIGDAPVAAADAADTGADDPVTIPEVVSRAGEWGGSGSPAQVVENLRAKLHEIGYVSHGDRDQGVPGGHGADRIRALLTAKVMRGDAEQYAVALALMVRAKGFPARVVVGFRNPSGPATEQLRGAQLTAWVEVPFEGFGWVAFDPLPDEQKPPPTQKPDQDQQQAQPQRAQPPPPPVPPRRAQADPEDQRTDPDDPQQDDRQDTPPPPPEQGTAIWGWVALGVGIPLLLLLPVAVVLLLKLRRRRRLAGTGTPDQRIAGAWRYLVGRIADLGATAPGATTRSETADRVSGQLAQRVSARTPVPAAPPSGAARPVGAGDARPEIGAGVLALARDADAGVFAPEPVDPEAARAYWQRVEQELAGIERRFTVLGRWRARLSLRSLRKEHR